MDKRRKQAVNEKGKNWKSKKANNEKVNRQGKNIPYQAKIGGRRSGHHCKNMEWKSHAGRQKKKNDKGNSCTCQYVMVVKFN